MSSRKSRWKGIGARRHLQRGLLFRAEGNGKINQKHKGNISPWARGLNSFEFNEIEVRESGEEQEPRTWSGISPCHCLISDQRERALVVDKGKEKIVGCTRGLLGSTAYGKRSSFVHGNFRWDHTFSAEFLARDKFSDF